MTWGAPQWLLIVFLILGTAVNLWGVHKGYRPAHHVEYAAGLILNRIVLILILGWGGFFG